jgi:hypothetical protein
VLTTTRLVNPTSNIENIDPQPQLQPNKRKNTTQTKNKNQKTNPQNLSPIGKFQQQSKRNLGILICYFSKTTFALSKVEKSLTRTQPKKHPPQQRKEKNQVFNK